MRRHGFLGSLITLDARSWKVRRDAQLWLARWSAIARGRHLTNSGDVHAVLAAIRYVKSSEVFLPFWEPIAGYSACSCRDSPKLRGWHSSPSRLATRKRHQPIYA